MQRENAKQYKILRAFYLPQVQIFAAQNRVSSALFGYTVALSTRTRQMDGDRLFWNLLPVIILAVPVLLALGAVAVTAVVIILIVRLVKAQKRKQSANAHKTQ